MMRAAAIEEGTKVCSKCKEEKSKSEFYKHTSRRDGLQSRCKACSDVANAKIRHANKLKNASGVDATGAKVCATCKEEKPKCEFGKNTATRDGLRYSCKTCTNDANKKRRLANKLKNARGVDMAGTKTCLGCHEEKEKTEFSACLGFRDGLHTRCKQCRSRDSRELAARNRRANEKVKARHVDVYAIQKYCPACGETKSSDACHSNVASKSGLSSYCRKCANQRLQSYNKHQNELTGVLAARANARWSRSEDEFVIKNHGVMTVYQMAIKLGRTRASVSARTVALRRDGKLL